MKSGLAAAPGQAPPPGVSALTDRAPWEEPGGARLVGTAQSGRKRWPWTPKGDLRLCRKKSGSVK